MAICSLGLDVFGLETKEGLEALFPDGDVYGHEFQYGFKPRRGCFVAHWSHALRSQSVQAPETLFQLLGQTGVSPD